MKICEIMSERVVTIHMEERFLHGVSEKKFNHAPKESGMSGIKLDTLAY